MSILTHRRWPTIRRFVKLSATGRPRRIDLVDVPYNLAESLLETAMRCVHCGRRIHPIRKRRGGKLYYSPACPLDVNIGCSRGPAASIECVRVRDDVLQWQERQRREAA